MTTQIANRFTVEERGNCVIVYGAISAPVLSAIATMVPKESVMSPRLATMLDASFAFGLSSDIDALIDAIKPEVEAKVMRQYAGKGLSAAAQRWLASGERGISSNTMFTRLTGFNALKDWHPSPPADPADFRRCRLLLEQCPELVPLLPNMAEESHEWAGLVREWDMICKVMDDEVPAWRAGKSRTPATNTYNLIKKATGN